MAFENMDDMDSDLDINDSPPPEESGNRTFLIAAGVLGSIAVLALICIALYALVLLPRQRVQQDQQVATLNAQNTQVAMAITQTSSAARATFTPTVTPVPPTATSTPTSVVVVPTNTRVPTQDPRTATISALLTQASITTQTMVPTAVSLPTTGFADEVGLPALFGVSVALIGVFFLARRLRSA